MLQSRRDRPTTQTFRKGQRARVSTRSKITANHGYEGTIVLTWRSLFGRQWCILEIAHNVELTVPARELDVVPASRSL